MTMLDLILIILFAVLVSTFAMMSGGEGAILFMPFFLWLGVSPVSAVATAFVTQLVGKSSGTVRYALLARKQPTVQWGAALRLVMYGAPFVIAGSLLTYYINPLWLKALFGTVMIAIAALMACSLFQKRVPQEIIDEKEIGRNWYYPAIAGLATGMTAIGSGTINMFLLEWKLKFNIYRSAATVVAVLAFTALIGAAFHIFEGSVRWDIAPFTMAGVLIGGQIGPCLACRLKEKGHERNIKKVFIAITLLAGLTMLWGSGILAAL
jgi:uncharacterized membrane protein YfcA